MSVVAVELATTVGMLRLCRSLSVLMWGEGGRMVVPDAAGTSTAAADMGVVVDDLGMRSIVVVVVVDMGSAMEGKAGG